MSRSTFTDEDNALLGELGVEVEAKREGVRSAREERVIAGFEEVQRFVEEHGCRPRHGEDRNIFERLYAVRLDRLRELAECRALLEPLDHQGLLRTDTPAPVSNSDELDDEALLAELGVDVVPSGITELRHVRSAVEKREAEEIANRQRCEDFDRFKPLFEQVQVELQSGLRETRRFERKSEIAPGRFYVLGGQKAYVAAMEEPFTNEHGNVDARLRVVFDNGTESNMLMRSLQKALQQDPAGRRLVEPSAGPLFADQSEDGDEASCTIYVLRSRSDHPLVAANRELIHKIGVTNGSMEQRIAGAQHQPTFLMAPVEVVATYELFNINRTKLENLVHRVFGPAKLNIEVTDRFGRPIVPREWFLVPLFVIDEAVNRIRNGSILGYRYDPASASLRISDQ